MTLPNTSNGLHLVFGCCGQNNRCREYACSPVHVFTDTISVLSQKDRWREPFLPAGWIANDCLLAELYRLIGLRRLIGRIVPLEDYASMAEHWVNRTLTSDGEPVTFSFVGIFVEGVFPGTGCDPQDAAAIPITVKPMRVLDTIIGSFALDRYTANLGKLLCRILDSDLPILCRYADDAWFAARNR